MLKKIILFSVFLFFLLFNLLYAYDNKTTHRRITERSIPKSIIDIYLKNNLGIKKGIDEGITGKKVWEYISDGAYHEDEPNCRASNHFHNPLPMSYYNPTLPSWSQSGIGDLPALINAWCADWNKYSNITWATGYLSPPPDGSKIVFPSSPNEPINWDKARYYYYKALTLTQQIERDIFSTWYFNAVGQVMHLLQDMSVPAHTRNDFTSHLTDKNATSMLSEFVQPYEHYVEANPALVMAGDPVFPSIQNMRLTDLWDTDLYDGNNQLWGTNIGLAEFSNANYLSSSTILNNHVLPVHTFPYPNFGILNMNPGYQLCSYELFPGASVSYISRTNRGPCSLNLSSADHFAVVGLLDVSGQNNFSKYIYLDDNVHRTYAKELLPRAVGYSASLLNYFFRGALEISAPARCLYSLIDGSSSSDQKFTKIKAKVKNITPNESIIGGSLIAVAKYKVWTGYESDLSNGQPTSESFATDFSYSVSAPVTLDPSANAEDIQALNSDSKEFTFNFIDSPIPAGITDLYLQIVFKGTLGNELDNAIAVGFKDLSEPTHMNFWNITDYVYNSGQLRPAIESETDIIDEKVAFCPSNLPVQDENEYQVQYTQLHPGRFGRLIFISDPAIQIYYGQSDIPDNASPVNTWSWTWPAVYQNNAVGENTGVYQYRGRGFNQLSAYYNSLTQPDAGFWDAAWPVSALDAVSATSFNW